MLRLASGLAERAGVAGSGSSARQCAAWGTRCTDPEQPAQEPGECRQAEAGSGHRLSQVPGGPGMPGVHVGRATRSVHQSRPGYKLDKKLYILGVQLGGAPLARPSPGPLTSMQQEAEAQMAAHWNERKIPPPAANFHQQSSVVRSVRSI